MRLPIFRNGLHEEFAGTISSLCASFFTQNINLKGTVGICAEVLSQWNSIQLANNSACNAETLEIDVDAKLSSIMGQPATCIIKGRELSSDEKALRNVILAQYSEVQDGGTETNSNNEAFTSEGLTSNNSKPLVRNINSEVVANVERVKREKLKEDHEKKKAQDKLNKEKQKQAQVDRKEKEKKRTQKMERKR